jgi:NAD(P)-dependent dehydrogenase (short-subunit alcohol dehydrogenase family)
MFGYAPYHAAKMAVNKTVEQLYYETPACKFFALGPGYIDTKIHKPTLEKNWYNPRIEKGNPNTVEQVYECLKWCIEQPKEVIGGRNICVSDPYGPELAERLKANQSLYKLRRVE